LRQVPFVRFPVRIFGQFVQFGSGVEKPVGSAGDVGP